MQNGLRWLLPLWLILFICSVSVAQTNYKSGFSVHLLFGQTFEPPETDIATLTLEHTGSYGVFEHFAFIDGFYETGSTETSAHLEWYPKVSLSGSGRFGPGALQEVLLGGGINADFGGASDLFVWLVGPIWRFSIPGFESFELETYYYKQTNESEYNGTYQITPGWDILLPLTPQWRFRLTGFADFIGDRGPGVNQIITQPQFLLDVGNFWGDPGRFYAGIEWHYWKNVGGAEGVDESVVQLELRIDL